MTLPNNRNLRAFACVVTMGYLACMASLLPAQSESKEAEAAPAPQADGADAGWIVLFDGSNLDAWRGYKSEDRPAGWVIEDGALFRKSGGDDLTTKEAFDDFELSFEWKVAKASNSGIMYRARLGDAAPYISGLEYQILEDSHPDGKNPLTHAGSLYALYPTQPDLCKPIGQWNSGRILVQGNHVEHWLNGVRTVDCEMWGDDWNQRLEQSKFKGWDQFGRTSKGHLALQDHGDHVWYRKISVRKLPAAAVESTSPKASDQ